MPSEIAAFERETAAKQAANAERLDMLMDALIEHRREPMYVVGFWAQYWLHRRTGSGARRAGG